MMKKIIIMVLFLRECYFGASVSSGIGMLSMSMKGILQSQIIVSTFGLGLVNDFHMKKIKDAAFYLLPINSEWWPNGFG